MKPEKILKIIKNEYHKYLIEYDKCPDIIHLPSKIFYELWESNLLKEQNGNLYFHNSVLKEGGLQAVLDIAKYNFKENKEDDWKKIFRNLNPVTQGEL